MNSIFTSLRRFLVLPVMGLVAAADIGPSAITTAVAVTTAAVTLSTAPEAQALPVHRVARRTARRTTRRVVRRHMFVLPATAMAVTFGPYRYYRCGGIYYYPYMIGGRTTYIEIDVDTSGNPMAPPPASQVEVEIDIN